MRDLNGVVTMLACACAAALLLPPDDGAASGANTIWTAAGNGTSGNSPDGTAASEAQIDRPRSIFWTADGGFVWAQPWSNRVMKVGPDGALTRIAGTGEAGFSGDGGPATAARINFVHSASPTADGGYVIADSFNNRIRRISPAGVITTVAGDGVAGYGGDGGPATNASINNPRGVTALPDGGFLIPDTSNHRVRKVSPSGVITTVAGTGVQGFSGDGGPATAAMLSIPFGVAPTPDGGFLIVDVGNQRIRKVSPSGVITTVAGTGVAASAGDGGPATEAQLYNPHNAVAQPDGGFLIAEATAHRIRRVDPAGIITTFAGNGLGTGTSGAFEGDGGPAPAARLNLPKAVATTPSGAVLIADEQNNRVRFVGQVVAPAGTSPPSVTGLAEEGRTLTATPGRWTGTGPLFGYQWLRCTSGGQGCVEISGATSKTYAATAADVDSTLRVRVTASNPGGEVTASSNATAAVAGAVEPPRNVARPSIAGTPAVGEMLTASPGTWSGTAPISFAYQWRRCNGAGEACADIPGATAAGYTVTAADSGSTLQVRVAASNGATASVYSQQVEADSPLSYWRLGEAAGALVDARGFKSGSAVNAPQRGAPGLIAGDGGAAVALDGTSQYLEFPADPAWTSSTFSIEISVKPSVLPANKTIWSTQEGLRGWWLNTDVNGVTRMYIGDGSGWRYTTAGPPLTAGRAHHLVATYDGSRARLYVNGVLASTGPVVTMAPNTGTAPMRIGQFAGAGQFWPGVVDDASFYGVALSAAQVAAHHDASVNGSTATSAVTALVGGAPVAPSNSGLPVVSGVAEAGSTLTASSGSWSGTAPMSYAYQWRRCDASGGACVDVGGNASSYGLTGADVGSRLRVVVTASNGAGSSSAESAATGVVAAQPSSGTLSFAVAAGGDDGDVWVEAPQSAGYPPSGTPGFLATRSFLTVGRRAAFGGYEVLVGLLRFDTSALPDGATVTSASLRVHVRGKVNGDNRGLMAEWYDAANWPIDGADWSLASSGSALPAVGLAGIPVGSVSSFDLTGLGSVSTTGATALRLHLSGGQPAGDNYLQLAAFEDPTLPEPQLVVNYTLP